MADKSIGEMNKDELYALALTHGVELERSRSLKALREQVATIVAQGVEGPSKDEPLSARPEYLKHPVNGHVFAVTDMLLARGDMLPCDKDGNAIALNSA